MGFSKTNFNLQFRIKINATLLVLAEGVGRGEWEGSRGIGGQKTFR